jgi:NAD(P)-dependent dehydrogenase (short-subunit alcohol dehydrogenase family)
MNVPTSSGSATVALVTGATGAIGRAIARQLSEKGIEVVLGCRDQTRAEQAVEDIRHSTSQARVRYELVDVSRKSAVLALADRWKGALHILINNAATAPRDRLETPEGIEVQLATNVLGYVWMVDAFTDVLKSSAPARVVNVASYWAGDLDLQDLEFTRRQYNNGRAYRQSKQANRMLTVAQAEQLKPLGITVNACHPGDVNSGVSNSLGFGGHESPDQGAATPVWLATSPVGLDKTGRYFEHMQEVRDPFAQNRPAMDALYQACLRY